MIETFSLQVHTIHLVPTMCHCLLFLARTTGMATDAACDAAGAQLARYAMYGELLANIAPPAAAL